MAQLLGQVELECMDVKRFYLPGIQVKDNCPVCGMESVKDLGDDYMSYPMLNHPEPIRFWCESAECGHHWEIGLILKLTVEIANDQKGSDQSSAEG